MRGGNGNDQSIAESTVDGADVFFGDAGTDTMAYSLRTTTVFVSPDNLADDGAFGEGDNVDPTVENITGGLAGDFMIGNELANRLFGLGSDVLDAVDGIAGNDVIDGAQGTGADSCTADPRGHHPELPLKRGVTTTSSPDLLTDDIRGFFTKFS